MEAHEEERSWIARDLHDDIGQRLVGLTMLLRSIGHDRRESLGDFQYRINALSDQFSILAGDVQAVSRRLHSSKLDHLGLAAASEGLCEELAARHAVNIEFAQEGVPSQLPKELGIALFRVLQEALNNAVRHSGVRQFAVLLEGRADEIQLEVIDKGVGFSPKVVTGPAGLGLISMQERLNLVDGELEVESAPGTGTRVRARVPLHLDPTAANHESQTANEPVTGH
jgi:signal transduction histidine kinase